MHDLEINLLRAFVAVADSGSFTAAARVVTRSQSAVSQKVLRIEEIIGRRVFDRNSRTLALTVDGERLLVSARDILAAHDRLLRAFDDTALAGRLRLGISEDFLPGRLAQLLARFARLYPGVEIALTTGLSCNLIDGYRDGQFDAVIARTDPALSGGRVIWREAVQWMARAGQLPETARPAPLVMLPQPCSYRDVMIATLTAAGRDWDIACTASNLPGVQAAVSGGLGIAAMGASFLQDDMQVLRDTGLWPALPPLEISFVGEAERGSELSAALVSFLTDSIAGLAPVPA